MGLKMNTENKVIQLITQLIRETANGTVKWVVSETPYSLNQDTEQSVPLFLQTEYKGKTIGLYDLRVKHFYDEHDYYWSELIGFCVIDQLRRVVWETTEYSQALRDLFNTAREQASGINDILDDLLRD